MLGGRGWYQCAQQLVEIVRGSGARDQRAGNTLL